ncbi:hypothetical protein HanIR_Chr12g0578751 [Helianthus annuus]|nr:hypothetical protein HanIR_Chr12g0578751 [Helianthus annuus]
MGPLMIFKINSHRSSTSFVVLSIKSMSSKPTVTDEDDSGTKTKERSVPVLIDKFASKRPAVYPMIAQAVLAPPKPGKAPDPGKFNDNFLKKSSATAHRPKGY